MLVVISGRFMFLLDYSSDIAVTRQLLPSRPEWSAVPIAFAISIILILTPYFTMLVLLRPSTFTDIVRAVARDVGETVARAAARVVDEARAHEIGTAIAGLHPSHGSVRALVIYVVFGVPILFFTDLYMHIRYIVKEPKHADLFNYMQLRRICELVESVGQLTLQMCIFAGQTNPCGFFRGWPLEIVSVRTLLVGIPSSLWSLKDGRMGGEGCRCMWSDQHRCRSVCQLGRPP